MEGGIHLRIIHFAALGLNNVGLCQCCPTSFFETIALAADLVTCRPFLFYDKTRNPSIKQ